MNHFHFGSSNAASTAWFYEKYFGFCEVKQLGKTRVLKNQSGFILAIDENEAAEPIPRGTHLGFTLGSPDEVQALFIGLQHDEFALTGELQIPSLRAIHFYCFDPSLNRVEVGWYDF